MSQKRPSHCRGCIKWHSAGHPPGSQYAMSKFNNWCCKYSTSATKALSICIQQNGKTEKSDAEVP